MRIAHIALGLSLLVSTGCFTAAPRKEPTVESIPVGACNPLPCANITIASLPPLPESFSLEARSAIMQRVARALYAPLDTIETEATQEQFIESVKAHYDEYLQVKDPETVVDWQVSRSAFIIFANDAFVSVVVKNEGYLGGAHGFRDEQIFVFDGQSGKVLTWDDILVTESRDIFVRAAEAEFRRARDIKPSESLEEAGFTFPNDTFALPLNFAITDRGVSLHYNPYEVGPYVMGPTDCVVPIDVAGPALNTAVINLTGVSKGQGLL
ncbi:MAG: hypothetical protein RIS36_2315 [Pseudomonadota bacterium]